MKPNIWMYADDFSRGHTAESLVQFAGSTFKRAKIVKDIHLLKQLLSDLNSDEKINHQIFNEFFFEYLIDCVRIVIFFENYMKAELIIKGYCIHKIKKGYPNYELLIKTQRKRPISLQEIQDIEAFEFYPDKKELYHGAIQETTLGFSDLTTSEAYLKNYKFDLTTLDYVRELNYARNKLHLHHSIEFTLSEQFLETIKNLDSFVDMAITNFKNRQAL
jgi:hypothetical protein